MDTVYMTTIGSADGPTSIFLAGELGMGWISLMGLIIVALLLLPNMIFTVKKQATTGCYVKSWIDTVEKVTRITTMLLMIFQLGVEGFHSILAFLIYLFGNVILVITYWVVWILYKKKQTLRRRMILGDPVYRISAVCRDFAALVAACQRGYFCSQPYACAAGENETDRTG